jgi:FixJ family two-component response regulator
MAGKLNKTIADELSVSTRTVEIHRAHLMEKMQASSLSVLLGMSNRIKELMT